MDARNRTNGDSIKPRSTTRRGFMGTLATAATATALAAGDVSATERDDQAGRLMALADRENSERWEYDTTANLASVESGLVNAQIDCVCDHPSGSVETYAVDGEGVPLCFEAVTDDREHRIGNLVHLSAEDAEALAVDLLEQAHAAREYPERKPEPQLTDEEIQARMEA